MIINLLRQIPDVVWAAVIASILTLSGVLLTNRGSSKRLTAQLKHDNEQRKLEREMALRRDVYLEAAKSISTALSAIVRVFDVNLSNEELGKLISDSSSSISKIHVIGKDAAVLSTAQFSSELGNAFLKLVTDRIPLVNLKQRISILEGFIDKATKERDGLIEMMKDQNIKGNADRRLWEVLNENFNFQGKQLDKYIAERDSINKELVSGQLNFLGECCSHHTNLRRLLTKALFAIRNEMEIPINEDNYNKFMEEEIKKQTKLLEEWTEQVKKSVLNA